MAPLVRSYSLIEIFSLKFQATTTNITTTTTTITRSVTAKVKVTIIMATTMMTRSRVTASFSDWPSSSWFSASSSSAWSFFTSRWDVASERISISRVRIVPFTCLYHPYFFLLIAIFERMVWTFLLEDWLNNSVIYLRCCIVKDRSQFLYCALAE